MRGLLAILLTTALTAPIVAVSAGAESLPSYKVIAEERTEGQHRIDIRLERRVNEEDVNALAEALVNRESKPYPRTLVNFRLPSMKLADDPWASATITRELRVKIPGLRHDEVQLFTAEHHADTRDVVGGWLLSPPAQPGRLTIFRDKRRVYAEWRMRDGTVTREELRESRISGGARFDMTGSEEHFRVYGKGDLELRTKDKLIAIAERIKPAAPAAVAKAPAAQPAQAVVAPAAAAVPVAPSLPVIAAVRSPLPGPVEPVSAMEPASAQGVKPTGSVAVKGVKPVAAPAPVKVARPGKPTNAKGKAVATAKAEVRPGKRRRDIATAQQTAI